MTMNACHCDLMWSLCLCMERDSWLLWVLLCVFFLFQESWMPSLKMASVGSTAGSSSLWGQPGVPLRGRSKWALTAPHWYVPDLINCMISDVNLKEELQPECKRRDVKHRLKCTKQIKYQRVKATTSKLSATCRVIQKVIQIQRSKFYGALSQNRL